ncbi:MAG: efflux RND transporter periplasmic adaptor subunit, partial [Gammaproteobacteria bacterium]
MASLAQKIAAPLIALAILGIMILWLAGAFEAKISPGVIAPEAGYQGQVLSVDWTETPVTEQVTGTVRSKQTIAVAAQIMARIGAIEVKAGDSVKAGDLLIRLDSTDLSARAAQAKAHVNALKARELQSARHFERTAGLYQEDSATKAEFEQAQAQYQSLKSQLSAAVESLKEAENALSYGEIRAPTAGRIVDRFVEPGDLAAPGMKLLSLYDPDILRIEANV